MVSTPLTSEGRYVRGTPHDPIPWESSITTQLVLSSVPFGRDPVWGPVWPPVSSLAAGARTLNCTLTLAGGVPPWLGQLLTMASTVAIVAPFRTASVTVVVQGIEGMADGVCWK